MNWQHMPPTQLGSMGHCVGSGNVSLLGVTRGKAPKTPTMLRYSKLKKIISWLVFTHNKKFATLKDNIKKITRYILLFKNRFTYLNKNNIFIYLFIIYFRKLHGVCFVNGIYKIKHTWEWSWIFEKYIILQIQNSFFLW